MASLLSLPFELRFVIFSQVAVPDLVASLRVSKALKTLVEQILYQNLDVVWNRGRVGRYRRLGLVQQSSFHKLHRLVFSLLRSPERSSYVHHLHIDVDGLENVWYHGETRITKDELDLLRLAISSATTHVELKKRWLVDVIAGVPNAYVALLLFQVRNLISLDIGRSVQSARYISSGDRNIDLDHLLQKMLHPAALKPNFSASSEYSFVPDRHFVFLEQFRYSCVKYNPLSDTTPLEVEPRHFRPALYAPHIRSMELYLFTTQDVFSSLHLQGHSIASSLPELVLHRYLAGLGQLKELILVTPYLQILKLDYWVDCDTPGTEKPHLDVTKLFEVLHRVRRSLKELQISSRFFCSSGEILKVSDQGGDFHDQRTTWGIKGSAPPLEEFEQLQVLDIPTPILLGWNYATSSSLEKLPSTLRKLSLRDGLWNWTRYTWNSEAILQSLAGFMESSHQLKKGLKCIAINWSSHRRIDDADSEAMGKIRLLLHDRGLDFDFEIYYDEHTSGGLPTPLLAFNE
jgi:hypothetical protein